MTLNLAFLGGALVKLACFMAVYGVVASVWGAKARREDLIQSGNRAAFAVWGLVFLAVVILERALIGRDYSLEYVAEEIDNAMPLHYRIAALWGGMNGSLLWWALIAATYTSVCQFVNRDRFKELMPWVTAVCCYVLAFLTLLVGWWCDPFLLLADSDPAKGLIDMVAATGDGKGLNPLLQTYWMMIHPPSLYIGYIGFTIPFAFCIGALVIRRVDGEFLRATRRWTLWAWAVLGFGVLLGSKWAYEELGWGGYWGWDPVENASFMPWIIATAYVHGVIIQEKRGMLKGWNVFLILLTFTMTYFGTFLTRSGVVQSVHAFGSGPVGWLLGGFVGSLILLSLFLLITRSETLRAENEIEAVLSREATFLYNNVGLLGMMLMILIGTMFPVLSEAIKGNKVVVGPPFFNPLAGLLTLMLLVLMGVGQLVSWRKTSPMALRKNFTVPLAVTGVAFLLFELLLPKEPVSLLLIGKWNIADPWAVALWTSCVFVTIGIVWEYTIGTRAILSSHGEEITASRARGESLPAAFRIAVGIIFSSFGWAAAGVLMPTTPWWARFGAGIVTGTLSVAAFQLAAMSPGADAVFRAISVLFLRNRRRYGGYVVHLGLVMIVAGIVGSSLYKLDRTITFKEGETVANVGGLDLTYKGLDLHRDPGVWKVTAYLEVARGGKRLGMAYPAKHHFDKGEQPTTEVSIHENALRDYYTILESYTDDRLGGAERGKGATATIRILVAPMVTWLWAGGLICLAGTAVCAWPARRRVLVPAGESESLPISGGASAPEGVAAGRER